MTKIIGATALVKPRLALVTIEFPSTVVMRIEHATKATIMKRRCPNRSVAERLAGTLHRHLGAVQDDLTRIIHDFDLVERQMQIRKAHNWDMMTRKGERLKKEK